MGKTPGVADIFRHAGPAYRERHRLDGDALKVMTCIEQCRTPALGGTLYRCGDCGHLHAVWKSCGNRHCPTCQGAAAHAWMERQAACILPAPCFHIVFTLPPLVARIALQNRKAVLDILFRTATETLQVISADPRRFGARIGGTAVVHTWNQKLQWHPHVHCVVPHGGFDVASGAWKTGSSRFFAPVKVLASSFRRRFLEDLAKLHGDLEFHGALARLAEPHAFSRLIRQARKTSWVVYAKPPFNGPEAVIRYLSRYTHRVAISDARILAFEGDTVTFRHRKPLTKAAGKPTYGSMTLTVEDFIRRFLMHRLPKGFHRIRHFGILANSCRSTTLEAVPQADWRDAPEERDEPEAAAGPACPRCAKATVPVATLDQNISSEDLARTMERIRMRGPP